ncbi:Panacea domain-containing protein [Pseudomonas sp. BNK-6]|uniref:Panacea domain-containing protein n=1 Tax=unclassified Pseudomonas TaxID=196821 RepID=UPI001A9F1414|nr:type II toxin-antitoxin system antitoxin SocA domain-containing protein [Pseudomonas sp. 50_B]
MSRDARAVAQQILNECREAGDPAVTPMQLLKLVYIAHGYMLARHGVPLINEPVQAWQYGPVVRSVYQAVRDFRSSPVTQVPSAPMENFNADERTIMRDVARTYGKADGVTLSAATHQPGTPWSVTWNNQGKNAVISNDMIESFYRWILSQPTHSML